MWWWVGGAVAAEIRVSEGFCLDHICLPPPPAGWGLGFGRGLCVTAVMSTEQAPPYR